MLNCERQKYYKAVQVIKPIKAQRKRQWQKYNIDALCSVQIKKLSAV